MTYGLAGVVVRHGRDTRLESLDLELAPGTSTAVIGGDGAGKTTLLRTLVGAITASDGRVELPQRDRIGYVSAGPGVYPDLTVDENLRFAGAAYGVRGARLAERIEELLAVTGLRDARHRLAARLSGGMRQKLGFACATLHGPELLVMDEPTTGVDPVSRAELWRLVSAALATGTTAVFSSTYVDEAARADHVLLLDRGRVLAAASPEAIRTGVPGRVVRVVASPPAGLASWRRGRVRHVWVPPGDEVPASAEVIEPDLEDAVVVTALAATTPQAQEVPA